MWRLLDSAGTAFFFGLCSLLLMIQAIELGQRFVEVPHIATTKEIRSKWIPLAENASQSMRPNLSYILKRL